MSELSQFFPMGMQHYAIGGVLIGLGVGLLYLLTGLVGGASSVFSSTWSFFSRLSFFQQATHVDSRGWRLVYTVGLVIGAALWLLLSGSNAVVTNVPTWQLAVGGFIAGFGARLGNGCTSGHGICGIASLNGLSLVAVLVFLSTAMLVANLVGMFAGGAV